MTGEALRWGSLRRDAIAALARDGAVVALPTGSVEQHGPHLPLDTDSFTAEAVCLRAAGRAACPVVVAPTVPWGVSSYWMGFPGTLTVGPRMLEDLLVELVRSIAAHGFRHIAFVNGHAGNAGVLQGACQRLAGEGIRAVGIHYWSAAGSDLAGLTRSDEGRIGHAGELETSLQLHLRPETVGPLPSDGEATRMPRSVLPSPFGDVAIAPPDPAAESPTGVYGDPSVATAELGERAFEAIVASIARFLEALGATPVPGRAEPSPGS